MALFCASLGSLIAQPQLLLPRLAGHGLVPYLFCALHPLQTAVRNANFGDAIDDFEINGKQFSVSVHQVPSARVLHALRISVPTDTRTVNEFNLNASTDSGSPLCVLGHAGLGCCGWREKVPAWMKAGKKKRAGV
eukprot:1138520-Pelagomonas_calceolata.AAC.5